MKAAKQGVMIVAKYAGDYMIFESVEDAISYVKSETCDGDILASDLCESGFSKAMGFTLAEGEIVEVTVGKPIMMNLIESNASYTRKPVTLK